MAVHGRLHRRRYSHEAIIVAMTLIQLSIQLFTIDATVASPRCMIVRDCANAQDIKLEAYGGANAVRIQPPR